MRCARPTIRLCITLAAVLPFAQYAQAQTVTVNHGTRTATVVGGDVDTLTDGAVVRMRNVKHVSVRLTNTNSALYKCAVTDSAVSVPELDSLKAFARVLGTYALDIGTTIPKGGGKLAVPLGPPVDAGQLLLGVLDELLHGKKGLHQARLGSLAIVDDLRRDSLFNSDTVLARVKQEAQCEEHTRCDRLETVPNIVRVLTELDVVGRRLHAQLAQSSSKGPTDTAFAHLTQVAAAVDKALADEDKILSTAYATERLVSTVAHASTTIDCKTMDLAWDKGRAFKVAVTPVDDPDLARMAVRRPYALSATALPAWRVRPQLGLALVAAPQALYPKFKTTKAAADSATIISGGTQNSRVSYGLVLGLTSRFGGDPDGGATAFWLPEIVVNPSSDVKSVGVGVGLGFLKYFRVSMGALWTKHTELIGSQQLGQTLVNADALTTEDTYRSAKKYFSFAIVGFPPFVRESSK